MTLALERPMRLLTPLAAATLLAGAAQAAPMTYAEAVKLAGRSAPSLDARSADVAAAKSSAVAAGRLPDPKLAFGLNNFPISGPPAGTFNRDEMTMATVGVVQDVPNGARRAAAKSRAAADIAAAETAELGEARKVRLATALAWIDLYYAKRKLAALEEIDHAIASLRTSAPAQVAAGAMRPAQAIGPDQLGALLGDRRADLVAGAGKARAELARWTGDPEADVTGDPPEYNVDPAALHAGLDTLPRLTAYAALGRQADAELAAARADKRPDWSWSLSYEKRDPTFGDMVSLGATVSLPLFPGRRQDPVIAARAQTANRVRFDREAERRTLTAELDAALADHVMHHDQLGRARQTLEPLARRKAELERASYAAGTAGLSDVLSAFLDLANAKFDTLDREAAVGRDAARIVLTYGSDDQ